MLKTEELSQFLISCRMVLIVNVIILWLKWSWKMKNHVFGFCTSFLSHSVRTCCVLQCNWRKKRCSWIHYWLHYSIRRYQDECSNNLSWLQLMFLSSHKENMQSCKPQFVPAGGANVMSHKVQTVCRCWPQIFDAKSRIGRAKKCHDFGLSINLPV